MKELNHILYAIDMRTKRIERKRNQERDGEVVEDVGASLARICCVLLIMYIPGVVHAVFDVKATKS